MPLLLFVIDYFRLLFVLIAWVYIDSLWIFMFFYCLQTTLDCGLFSLFVSPLMILQYLLDIFSLWWLLRQTLLSDKWFGRLAWRCCGQSRQRYPLDIRDKSEIFIIFEVSVVFVYFFNLSKYGYAITCVEWLTYGFTHVNGKNWKEIFQRSHVPLTIQKIFENNFRNVLGATTIAGQSHLNKFKPAQTL